MCFPVNRVSVLIRLRAQSLSQFYISERRFRALSFPDLVNFKSGKEKVDFALDEPVNGSRLSMARGAASV